MPFKPGQSGNRGGRPKGIIGGRMQALLTLDKMLAQRGNQRSLMRALQKQFKADPLDFFEKIVMPLLPKESKLSLDRDGIMEWKSLTEAFPRPAPSAPSPTPTVPAAGSGE